MYELESNRLGLRPWTLNDVESAHEIWGDSEVLKYIGDPAFENLDQTRKSIESAIAKHRTGRVWRWAVVLKANAKILAGCGFHPFDDTDDLEIVYHLKKSSWGKGFGKEIVGLLLGFVDKQKITEKVIADTHKENLASQHILEHAGFVLVEEDGDDLIFERTFESSMCPLRRPR